MQPLLAKSWQVSPDGLTFTFKLHDNIKFHDGSPLTSTDVKVSYERVKNPPPGVVSPSWSPIPARMRGRPAATVSRCSS